MKPKAVLIEVIVVVIVVIIVGVVVSSVHFNATHVILI